MTDGDADVEFVWDDGTPPKSIINQRHQEGGETTWVLCRFCEFDGWMCGTSVCVSYTDVMRATDRQGCAELLRQARTAIAEEMRERYPESEYIASQKNIVYH